jgi:hypothetical protein
LGRLDHEARFAASNANGGATDSPDRGCRLQGVVEAVQRQIVCNAINEQIHETL